ncbi:LOW QUALITY PROTEIN: eukaryotic translation initiation factor 2-alpha kinase-like [Hyalella azteca]|uniref:non-specific serine/threonine protein kinase n=1 Tax=Hyalella azteca TaxID=294128 RepID=A0A979FPZ4_HYAAZ|nr:LOW QUALITY PROTEIN: eukaryotic translation initiation factor 2-alpha kinase-like [Hyalella azteca]
MEDEPELEQDYVQLESLDYEVVNRRDDFTLPGSGTKFSQLPDCTDEEPIAEAGQNHVLVSTLDGDITSLDLETGAVLWRNSLGHQRLLSTSSAGLQMVAAGKMIQLVPSLDGMLYQISKGSDKLTALPVSADALKASTFKFDDETYVSGGYSSESFGLYAGSGALVYKCDHEGCKQRTNLDGVIPPLSDSDDVILVTKTMRNVYAFDPTLGIEKFNYSVGEHQVELVRSSGCRATAGRKAPSDNPTLPLLRFSLSDRLIQAELEDGTRLWKNRFDHPITGAWRLQDGELTKLDLLAPSNLYQLVPLHSTTPRVDDFVSPDVYLGRVGQQMYVQHSERLRMKLQAFSAANTLRRTNLFKIDGQLFERPSISWKPYFVRPPQLAHALPHDNGETSLAIQYHPDASSIDAAAGVDVAGANGHNQQSSATVTDVTHQDLDVVPIPDDSNIVTPDNNNRSNFGVYLFMNDALFDDGRPPIRRAIDTSPGLKYGTHDPPTAARDATSSQADSPWAWVVSWFNHSLSLTWQLRFPVSIVQSVLLCVCLLFTIQVFSPAWSKWLVTFLLAPLIALYAAFRKLWPTGRQVLQARLQPSNLPYTSLDQTYNCTAAPSQDVFQVAASQNSGQPQPQTGQGISAEPSGALFPYNRTIRHQQWPSVCPVADSQADHQTTVNDGSCGNPLARGRFNVPHSKDSKNQSSKIGNESSFTVDFDEGSSGIIFADSSKPELEEDGSFHNHVSESNDSGGNSHSFTFNQESSFIQSKDDSQLDEDFNYNSEKMDNDSSSSGSSAASCEDVAAENNGLTSAGSQSDSILFKDSTRPDFSEIKENGRRASNIGEEDENNALARPETLNLSDSLPSLSQARYAKRSRKNSRGPQDYLYIQMELCDPKTLKDWLMQNTERPKTKVLKFFLDIVNAVEHVHDKQMMHRDLKPSNIFFSLHQEDVLKVGDLGLVTHIADEDCDSHSARTPLSPSGQDDSAPSVQQAHHKHTQGAGTQTYMSPEQLRRVEYDYKVDIFSMGLILFEMLWPMRTDSERIRVLSQVRMLQFPEGFVEEHPEEHDLLQLMLNADPQKRPTTRGIRARAPLKQMQLPHELEAIKENEHFQLIKKHRRNTSSASSHDVAEVLAVAEIIASMWP